MEKFSIFSYKFKPGVPQGLVLSPFLFMIYLADIFEIIPDGVLCFVYADDIVLMYSGTNIVKVQTKLQIALDKIQIWCSEWKLRIDNFKCSACNFSNKRVKPDFNMYINQEPIVWSKHIKILGLYFSHNLTFRQHFNQKRKSVSKKINAFKGIASHRWGTRTCHLLNIAQTCITSSLDFGCHVFVSASPSDRKLLDIPFHTAINNCYGTPSVDSYSNPIEGSRGYSP